MHIICYHTNGVNGHVQAGKATNAIWLNLSLAIHLNYSWSIEQLIDLSH